MLTKNREAPHFHHLVFFLFHNFWIDHSLLEKKGTLILRRLYVLLDAQKMYQELSTVLEGEADLDFASVMVQALKLIPLTSSELTELRALLKQSLSNKAGEDLFVALYSSWCHSPIATISLFLLAHAYQHASAVIQSLVEEEINVNFFEQLDKLIHLLETPIFTYLRLQKFMHAQQENIKYGDNNFKSQSQLKVGLCQCQRPHHTQAPSKGRQLAPNEKGAGDFREGQGIKIYLQESPCKYKEIRRSNKQNMSNQKEPITMIEGSHYKVKNKKQRLQQG